MSETMQAKDTRRWWILAVLGVAQLMVVLDATVVNIALPSAQRALGFSNGDRQWVVTAYALAFGSLLLLGGRLGNLFGFKRTFLVGLVGFAAASAVGGAAPSFDTLIAARAVQGAFGALLAPATLALLSTTFTETRERARAFGVYSAIVGSGAAIGLLLGGVLTEYLSWRWCMYVNLFFAAVAFAGGWLLLRHQRPDDRERLDVLGVVLVSSGLFGVVYGFSHAESAGWSASTTLALLAAGGLLLIAFAVSQVRTSHPLLPMRVVLDRNRGGSYLAIFTVGVAMFGIFLFLTYYLQQTLGFSAVSSGLAFLPLVGALVTTAQVGTNVLSRLLGPRWIVGPGVLIASAGMWMLTRLDLHSSYAGGVLPSLLVFGAGLGLTMSSAMSNATARVQTADAGVASATANTGQQIGGSIGTSLLNTIAATAGANYATTHPAALAPTALLAQATLHSYTVVFTVAAAILLGGALVTGALLRPRPTPEDPAPAVADHRAPLRENLSLEAV